MRPEEFCQWMQGCLDIMETKTLNTKQVELIKEKLATVEGHQTSSLHAKKPVNITTPQQEHIYIPIPVQNPPHPDLGPYPTWQEKNPGWSGVMGQTNLIPLQTILSPSTTHYNLMTYPDQSYYEHHSDIPAGVVVSDCIGPRPAIGYNSINSYTWNNVPIKSHHDNGVSFGYNRSTLKHPSLSLSHVSNHLSNITASFIPMNISVWPGLR